jgi:ubiquinone/menaquinone biosynthesis C-methylase UbiE
LLFKGGNEYKWDVYDYKKIHLRSKGGKELISKLELKCGENVLDVGYGEVKFPLKYHLF